MLFSANGMRAKDKIPTVENIMNMTCDGEEF